MFLVPNIKMVQLISILITIILFIIKLMVRLLVHQLNQMEVKKSFKNKGKVGICLSIPIFFVIITYGERYAEK